MVAVERVVVVSLNIAETLSARLASLSVVVLAVEVSFQRELLA